MPRTLPEIARDLLEDSPVPGDIESIHLTDEEAGFIMSFCYSLGGSGHVRGVAEDIIRKFHAYYGVSNLGMYPEWRDRPFNGTIEVNSRNHINIPTRRRRR